VHQEAPIHISNVMLVDPESKKRTRVGSRFDDDGNKIRVAKRSSKDVS
ncbi:MAG TPA: 50S ribosomal protein L24, partial [Actinomycetes bacterium]|nr:50S ribosomal protein L24 [Actinomycetes bacterium]